MIDFTLTEEQQDMREMAHAFAEKEIRPRAWELDRDDLRLSGGVLDVRAPAASEANSYVRALSLRGAPIRRAWLPWNDIAHGGSLRFRLGRAPSRTWATLTSDAPPSVTSARSGGY